MQGLLSGPGFLGTNAPFISDLSLVVIAVSAALFTYGRQLARTRRFVAHRRVQTAGVVLSTLMALGFMLRSFTTHILPGIPSRLLMGDYAMSTSHAAVATAALLLGVFIVLRGHNLMPRPLRFKNYKPIMRLSYKLYMLASLLGLIVYVMVFVLGI
jgi:uncharacterized membrane protein YozB (DUF420 family)